MKTALVTGANSKIGHAIVTKLLEMDFKVLAHVHEKKDLISTVNSKQMTLVQADLASADSVQKLAEECLKAGVDVLIHNAARLVPVEGASVPNAEWLQTLQVNLVSPALLSQALLPSMIAKKWGRIISLSSVGVKFGGSPVTMHYSVSKAALEALMKGIAKAGTPHGVSVNTVRVGVTNTGVHDRIRLKDMDARVAKIPAGRMGAPEEIADAVVFLASEKSQYISNATLDVTGGE